MMTDNINAPRIFEWILVCSVIGLDFLFWSLTIFLMPHPQAFVVFGVFPWTLSIATPNFKLGMFVGFVIILALHMSFFVKDKYAGMLVLTLIKILQTGASFYNAYNIGPAFSSQFAFSGLLIMFCFWSSLFAVVSNYTLFSRIMITNAQANIQRRRLLRIEVDAQASERNERAQNSYRNGMEEEVQIIPLPNVVRAEVEPEAEAEQRRSVE